jgi:hypothetical protein
MPRKTKPSQGRKKISSTESTLQGKLPIPQQPQPAEQKDVSPQESYSEQLSSSSKRLSQKRKYTDTETWVDRNLSDLIEIFNLAYLDLKEEEARSIAIKLVDMLRGEASTIDKDTIRRRFTRNIQQAYQVIAQAILELRDDLTLNQLEFVANNIGEAILGYAPRLYKEVIKHNKHDLLENLRTLWRMYWVQRKYQMLPVECPRCRFNSLMPDLSCVVCGTLVSEEELKRHLGFEKLLQDFVKQYSEEDVKKTITYGYVYLNSLGLKPPIHERDKLDIEILLSTKEKEYLKSFLASKGV